MAQSSFSTELNNLVQRVRAGDVVALRALARRASERLRTLARRLFPSSADLQCREEMAEAVENAVHRLQLALAAGPLGSPADFFVLAGRQMRRELLDLGRHASDLDGKRDVDVNARPSASVDAPWAGPPGPKTTPQPQCSTRSVELHVLVERLPAEGRQVFDLLWYQEFDREDAAAALGVSLTTLKRRWMSARLQLLDLLQMQPHST